MRAIKKRVFISLSGLSLIVVLTTVIFQSCVRNTIDITNPTLNWNPNIAAPLINTSLSIADIIANSNSANISVDKTNFCTLIYRSSLFSFLAKDLIKLPPQGVSQTDSLTTSQIATLQGSPGGTITEMYTQIFNFDTTGTGGILIDSMIYKSGLLTETIASGFQANIAIGVSIPAAKKAGIPFTQTLNLIYNSSSNNTLINTIDLSGYHFDMTLGGTTSNTFIINYTLTFTLVPGGTVFPTDRITLTQSCASPLFDKLFGYMGNKSLVPGGKNLDTCALSIFKNSPAGNASFTLQDPRLTFIISNSFGLPVNANLTKLIGFSTSPLLSIPITGFPSPLPILSPSINQIGQLKVDSFFMDNTNSNLAAAVNSSPQSIIYQLAAQANPGGVSHTNFVIDTSKIAVDISVQLPLFGTMKNFTIMDTIKNFSLNTSSSNSGSGSSSGSGSNPNVSLQSLSLYTTITNGFPDSANIQIYITDSLFHKPYIDSLLGTNGLIMSSGVVSTSGANIGQVISSGVSRTTSTLSAARMANINKYKKTNALVRAVMNTYNNGNTPVKIYSNYKVGVQIAAQTQLSVTNHHHN